MGPLRRGAAGWRAGQFTAKPAHLICVDTERREHAGERFIPDQIRAHGPVEDRERRDSNALARYHCRGATAEARAVHREAFHAEIETTIAAATPPARRAGRRSRGRTPGLTLGALACYDSTRFRSWCVADLWRMPRVLRNGRATVYWRVKCSRCSPRNRRCCVTWRRRWRPPSVSEAHRTSRRWTGPRDGSP